MDSGQRTNGSASLIQLGEYPWFYHGFCSKKLVGPVLVVFLPNIDGFITEGW